MNCIAFLDNLMRDYATEGRAPSLKELLTLKAHILVDLPPEVELAWPTVPAPAEEPE